MNNIKALSLLMMLVAAGASFAAAIPKDSKVLGATKGREIGSGLVFVNGKYIEPPYIVQRWGCGIKINKETVIAEVVPWTDFLKTQDGVKKEVTTTVKEVKPVVAPKAEPAKEEDDYSASLDDLFDDDPKPARKKPVVQKPVAAAQPKPSTTVSYSLEGAFTKNEKTAAMVKKINSVRAEIDALLRRGGFIFFGDAYSRVSGDAPTAIRLLQKLPGIERDSKSAEEVASRIRSAKFDFLPDALSAELFRNRVDYRALQERLSKWRSDAAVQKMIDEVSAPLL